MCGPLCSVQEVLSAVTTTKLLSCCALPEACSRALWLIVPQIMSSLVVRRIHLRRPCHPVFSHAHSYMCTLCVCLLCTNFAQLAVLQFIVRSSNQDPSLALALTVPTLALMTSLLNRGKELISSPHHVTLVLGALQTVALERLAPAAYRATFHAAHEALYAVISCHPRVRPPGYGLRWFAGVGRLLEMHTANIALALPPKQT